MDWPAVWTKEWTWQQALEQERDRADAAANKVRFLEASVETLREENDLLRAEQGGAERALEFRAAAAEKKVRLLEAELRQLNSFVERLRKENDLFRAERGNAATSVAVIDRAALRPSTPEPNTAALNTSDTDARTVDMDVRIVDMDDEDD